MVKYLIGTIRTTDNKKDIKGYIYTEDFSICATYIIWKDEVNKLSDCK